MVFVLFENEKIEGKFAAVSGTALAIDFDWKEQEFDVVSLCRLK